MRLFAVLVLAAHGAVVLLAGPSAAAGPNASTPCLGSAPPASYDHVVWIVFENKSPGAVIGNASAPYLTDLAHRCATAAGMVAEAHPSLPNYIWMTAGRQLGVTNDGPPSVWRLSGPEVFKSIGDWRALEESMPSNCLKVNSGLYAVKHNPAAYFTDLGSCSTRDVPLTSTPNLSARFTMIEPNLCNSMHDCSVATGDQWARTWIGRVLNSAQYQAGRTLVFVTFDENDGAVGNRIPTIVIAPSVRAGTVVGSTFNHCNMQHTTIEVLTAAPHPWAGCPATSSMRSAFHV